jgi:hypothetical protein
MPQAQPNESIGSRARAASQGEKNIDDVIEAARFDHETVREVKDSHCLGLTLFKFLQHAGHCNAELWRPERREGSVVEHRNTIGFEGCGLLSIREETSEARIVIIFGWDHDVVDLGGSISKAN